MQTTVSSPVRFEGIGLHSGAPVTMIVRPAAPHHGIWFKRTDIAVGDTLIPAVWSHVVPSQLCTRIENAAGVAVSTIEHIMAALAGCGVQNALVDIDGPEVPILDGSSRQFVEGLLAQGLREQDVPVFAIEVLQSVEVRDGAAFARLEPGLALEIDFAIDFADAAIGRQRKTLNMANGAFVRELSDSRTFCREQDVEDMRARGLALGGTFENAVVVNGADILSPGGLRHKDEAVRHKMLDALGDLSLAGAPLLGRYTGIRAGHAMTNKLLHALFADPANFRMVDCGDERAALLPGAGVTRDDLKASRIREMAA
ncbi:MAG: UDP-3-O-acyl-N-acetylglucosamine deacetylase [Deltaproteobacteria bacterium]